MGIDGLLKLLRPITEKEHISSFKDQRIGIDIMPWIYRGCYSCNFELAQNIASMKFLHYLLEMIEILNYYNIKPIFVFDGRNVEMKNQTQEKRKKEKEENREKGMKFLKEGKLDEARKYLSRCIFLDERIISTTMNVLFTKNIEFIVAPYEADCQIAKLKKEGLIDVAISEDSDLLVYNVNTILKLNQHGDCDYVDPSKWRPRDVDNQFLKQYLAMNHVNRVQVAILAGSDYNNSIKGIGIKRAVKHVYKLANIKNVITKLKYEKVYAQKIPEEYQRLAENSKLIFLFATVYNPTTKILEYLNPDLIDDQKPADMSLEELDKIVGQRYPEYMQKQIFCGKHNAKDLTPRVFQAVNIREMFRVNREDILVREACNNRRREEMQKMKEERAQQIQQGIIPDVEMKPGTQPFKKPTKQLTEEEKQERKKQRKQRIVKLHDVMNSFMKIYDEDEDCESSEEMEEEKQELSPQKIKKIQEEIQRVMNSIGGGSQMQPQNDEKLDKMMEKPKQNESSSQSQAQKNYQSQSESASVDLGFLNPFAKKIPESGGTASKQSSAKKSI